MNGKVTVLGKYLWLVIFLTVGFAICQCAGLQSWGVWSDQPVWLSLENQSNFSTAEHRAATSGDNLPHKEKIGQEGDGTPIYHTFDTAAELTSFWNACQDHIENCRKAGWEEKDAIDWEPYKALFPEQSSGVGE